MDFSPKNANLLNGSLRILNATALRASLGIGSIASQNSNSVSISGGSISNVNFSGGNYSGGNFSSGFLSNSTISNANSLSVTGATTLAGNLRLTPVIRSISGSILGNEVVSLVKLAGSGGGVCSGTPTNPCSSYSYSSCPTVLGCYQESIYCPDYAGDESACLAAGCSPTYDSYTCSDYYTDEESCNSVEGCSWGGDGTYYCSDIEDEESCNSVGGDCYWVGDEYSSCSDLSDEESCNSAGGDCYWNTDDEENQYCGGDSYLSGGNYCGGSTYGEGEGSCNGEFSEFNGGCEGEGGTCAGTASCNSLSSGACSSYAGCSFSSGINIIIPAGNHGQVRFIKNLNADGTDVFLTFANKLENGTTAKTLANYGDSVFLIFNQEQIACSTVYSEESSCNSDPDCYWYSETENSYCEGTKNLSMWVSLV
jgi:hypothetical protein